MPWYNSSALQMTMDASINSSNLGPERIDYYLASLLDFMDYHSISCFSEVLTISKDRLELMIIKYLDHIQDKCVCWRCRLVWQETAERFVLSSTFIKAFDWFCALHRIEKPWWDYIKIQSKIEIPWYNPSSGEICGYNR